MNLVPTCPMLSRTSSWRTSSEYATAYRPRPTPLRCLHAGLSCRCSFGSCTATATSSTHATLVHGKMRQMLVSKRIKLHAATAHKLCVEVPLGFHALHLRHAKAVSYTHLRAHETRHDLVCRLLLEKKK